MKNSISQEEIVKTEIWVRII